AADVAVEDVALDRLTQPRSAPRLIRFPPRREHERAADREVRLRRLLRRPLLEGDDVLLRFCDGLDDAIGLAVDCLQVSHRTASAFASSRSNRARKSGLRSESSP